MRAAFAALAIVAAIPANAATFTTTTLPDGRPAIALFGRIDPGDDAVFARRISAEPKATALLLSSPGGDLSAGIMIGQTMRAHGLAAIVAPHSVCASACAIAWLSGSPRYLASDARVGFHAIAAASKGAASDIPVGSALVGAYMARLGLSDAAIAYMNRQPPDRMAWLGWDDADRLQVHIAPFSEIMQGAPPKPFSHLAGVPFPADPVPLQRSSSVPIHGAATPTE